MNKNDFIDRLAKELSYSKEECVLINEILESNFFISKKNKYKIINDFIQKLQINYDDAMIVYNTAIEIINSEIKKKLRHPFKSN